MTHIKEKGRYVRVIGEPRQGEIRSLCLGVLNIRQTLNNRHFDAIYLGSFVNEWRINI